MFISLHTGYSLDKTASGSSIYVMKGDFTGGVGEPEGGRLFFPWYMAYRMSATASQAMAQQLQQNSETGASRMEIPDTSRTDRSVGERDDAVGRNRDRQLQQ